MKKMLIILLALTSLVANAKIKKDIKLNCGGEVRYGGLFQDAVFVPFDVLLTERLAHESIEVKNNNRYLDAEVTCSYKYDSATFYSLRHKAQMTITVKSSGNELVTKSFSCNALVQDGGNQTLKKSCAKKTAKEIGKILNPRLNVKARELIDRGSYVEVHNPYVYGCANGMCYGGSGSYTLKASFSARKACKLLGFKNFVAGSKIIKKVDSVFYNPFVYHLLERSGPPGWPESISKKALVYLECNKNE